jgi:hypothetical protein
MVQSIRDAGFEIAALADKLTLRGVPAFLEACDKTGVHPLVGATLPVGPLQRVSNENPIDVLSLRESMESSSRDPREPAVLLATSRRGYRNLIAILDRYKESGADTVGIDLLLKNRDGLFLIVGIPGSPLAGVVAAERPWTSVAWIEPLLKGWSRARLAFGGLYPLRDEVRTARILARLKQLPVSLTPIALTVAAYRNETERFWGMVKSLRKGVRPRSRGSSLRLVENREGMSRNLQGLSRSLRLVEKLSIRESDLSDTIRCSPPIYPTPRGADTPTFFWTLVQEAAIATGHIRTHGGKDRLYEEFQYLKQTPWPEIWLILWDLRRRLGLPPGTVRPTDEWVRASLSAHLLGLVRVDPLRERIPFQPFGAWNPEKGFEVEVEAPLGFESEIEEAATALLGEGRVGVCVPPPNSSTSDLQRYAGEILTRWEELGFTGDRPAAPPPLPAYLREKADPPIPERFNLLLSGAPLGRLFPTSGKGSSFLEIELDDALKLGATVFRFQSPPSQTLAAASRYRGEPEAPPVPAKRGAESITEWVEDHRGEAFQGEAYADDTGRLEVLGYSSCLLRLLTYPGSVAYRPLLSEWIRRAAPKNLGTLANLLALGWHWSFWSSRREWKSIAVRRPNPLTSVEASPPWWPEWERFLESSQLGSRMAGMFGAALEKATEPTGGWLLFHEQLSAAVEEGLGLSSSDTERWLRFDNLEEIEEPSDPKPTKIWELKVRQYFRSFLGGVTNLPSRLEFLKKAEALLSAAEGFSRDPVATTVLLSFLFEEESPERREVYEILKERGSRISLPNVIDAAPFDRSAGPGNLILGSQNVLGVGPKIAEILAPGWNTLETNPKRLFEPTTGPNRLSGSDWLAERARRPVDWKNLSRLIQLGMCDGFGESRAALVEKARRLLRKRSESGGAVQQTFFGLADGPSQTEREEEKAWDRCLDPSYSRLNAELDSLRFCVERHPYELYGEAVPIGWLKEAQRSESRWARGWVHEIDLFDSSEEEPETASRKVWMTFRLFAQGASWRVVDREGLLADCFPETIPEEIGLEGKRIHLKTPWNLVCEIHRPAAPCAPEYETFDLLDAEPVDEILSRAVLWAGIVVRLGEATPELQMGLEEAFACFAHDREGRSIPISFEIAEGVFRKGPLRRLAGRFAGLRLVGSSLVVRALGRLPGVEEARAIPSQKPLFPST